MEPGREVKTLQPSGIETACGEDTAEALRDTRFKVTVEELWRSNTTLLKFRELDQMLVGFDLLVEKEKKAAGDSDASKCLCGDDEDLNEENLLGNIAMLKVLLANQASEESSSGRNSWILCSFFDASFSLS